MSRIQRIPLPPPSGDAAVDSWRNSVAIAFGDLRFNFKNISSAYTVEPTDQVLQVETSGIVITLPSATNLEGKSVPSVKNVSGGDIYVIAPGTQTIDSVTTVTVADDESYSFYSDRTNWRVW